MSNTNRNEQSGQEAIDETTSPAWIEMVRDHLAGANQKVHSSLRATLQCKIVGNEPSLLTPPELAEDQPEVLEYLHAFTRANSLSLIEDRRRLDLGPIVEKRKAETPNLAMGICLLLKQTGLPGPTHSLCSPHSLRPGNRKINVAELVRLAAAIQPSSRKIVFLPNAFVRTRLLGETENMIGHACKVSTSNGSNDTQSDDKPITVVQFESRDFHALGYVTNNQLVVTVYLAGGPICQPSLWTHFYNLAETPFTCQVFESPYEGQMYGIFHKTFYIELDNEKAEPDNLLRESA